MVLNAKFASVMLVVFTCFGFAGGIKYQERVEQIKDENQCIKEMVQSGVERKHVFTNEGKCYLESPL